MANTTIPWNDGSGDNLYFSADAFEGNQEVLVSSDANAGSERSKTVTFSAQGAEPKSLGIIQLGSGTPTREFDDWVKDGDTHLWIEIVNDYQKAQEIRIRMIGTIDWGDGTAAESVSVTTNTSFTHTYANTGRYRIDLHPTSGTFYIGGGSTSWCIMGERNNKKTYKQSVLYQVEVGSSIINTITTSAFQCCRGLRRVFIPKTIISLYQQLFNDCTALTQVIFEDVTKITDTLTSTSFFYNCQALQDISGFSVKYASNTINQTIRNCFSLAEFIIPAAVTNISAASFTNTYGLKHLWVYPQTPPTVASANAFNGFNTGCVIHVPNGKLSAYQSANIWSTYASQMVEMPASS